jgi:RNA polymerase sigma-70 factor, ECF subfamily
VSEGVASVGTLRIEDLDAHRAELTGHCYRMLGSAFEAEDAVQEALTRAWRNLDSFEGRSTLRTWLHRIATNVCLDMVSARQRRARPMDLGPASTVAEATLTARPEVTWIDPIPDRRVVADPSDPAEVTVTRESVRLAFVAALQHLPARQRAVLLLRDVLRWQAKEVADLLDTTVASVNSALQRARATMTDIAPVATATHDPLDPEQQDLLARYVDAFERYDLDALTALLHEDVIQSMPPYDLWLQGHDENRAWYLGPGIHCSGSRLLPVVANGTPAFGQYRRDPAGGHAPWALQVVEIVDGRITGLNAFLDVDRLFPLFGLPPHLEP